MTDDPAEPVAVDVDRPLLDPRDDVLGRQPLARSLARLISTHQSGEGFVIALCGAWGSGKSTLLNFVEAYLKESVTMTEEQRPLVIRFNPWWFHGPENLLHHFLHTFQRGLGQDTRYADTAKVVRKYAAALRPVAGLVPGIGPLLEKILAAVAILCDRTPSPEELRRQINDRLQHGPRRILVMIDDIDRLVDQDIQEMFKLVKSVADFPKTVHLLAFDKGPVIGALNKISESRGEQYLNKIVQLEIDLPQPDPSAVRHLAVSCLKRLLGDAFHSAFSPDDLEDLYEDAIRHILRTVRDVKRYLNALTVTYPFVKDEVHPGDFVLVELLRTFAPSLYDATRGNPERFAGGDSEWEAALGGGTPQERRPFYDEVVRRLPDHLQAATLVVLKRLFPKVQAAYGALPSASPLSEEWRRDRRVCSPDVFPYYFQLSVPIGEVSEETFRALCRAAADRARFSQELRELAKPSQPGEVPRSRLLSFLQRLCDHPEAVRDPSVPNRLRACIGALFDVGDPIYGEDWEELRDSSVDEAIVGTIHRLLDGGAGLADPARALAEVGRYDHLRHALSSTPSLYVPALYISELVAAMSKGTSLVSSSHPDELKGLLCDRIDRTANDLSLAKVPRLLFVLSRWEEWCPDGSAKRARFIEQLLRTEEGPGRLLAGHLNVSHVTPGLEQPSRVEYRIDLRQLAEDVGGRDAMNDLYTRAAEMSQATLAQLTHRARVAIGTFREEWLRAE